MYDDNCDAIGKKTEKELLEDLKVIAKGSAFMVMDGTKNPSKRELYMQMLHDAQEAMIHIGVHLLEKEAARQGIDEKKGFGQYM